MVQEYTLPTISPEGRQFVGQHLKQLRQLGSPSSSPEEVTAQKDRIRNLLKRENAVLVAHYYTDPVIQELAQETEGCVADSLKMAQFGKEHSADTLIVAGVKFMGETAKILSPEKRVLMPTLDATCSLDIGCPPDEFADFCDQHSDRTVVVYANTSAAVKARADWVVTSSIAYEIIDHIDACGEKILWAPDKHLGSYLQKETGADMLLWDGACVVHEEFKSRGVENMMEEHPDAAVLVHPESPADVVALADAVGSTSDLIKATQTLPNKKFIVATDRGIFFRMSQVAPDKEFLLAPTFGRGADCRACGFCPWMAMNELDKIESALEQGLNEVIVDPQLIPKAVKPLQRMLDFAETTATEVKGRA